MCASEIVYQYGDIKDIKRLHVYINIHIQNTQMIQYKAGYDDAFCLGFTGGFGRALVLLGGAGALAELRPSVLFVEQRMLFLRSLVSAGL